VARIAATGRDQIPFGIGRAFVPTKLHAIENVLAIRRYRDRGGTAQTGSVVETEGMVGGLRGAKMRKHHENTAVRAKLGIAFSADSREEYQRTPKQRCTMSISCVALLEPVGDRESSMRDRLAWVPSW
jgi:hypothetical protein